MYCGRPGASSAATRSRASGSLGWPVSAAAQAMSAASPRFVTPGSRSTSSPANCSAVSPPNRARCRSSGRNRAPSAVMAAYRVLVPRGSRRRVPSGAAVPTSVNTKFSAPGRYIAGSPASASASSRSARACADRSSRASASNRAAVIGSPPRLPGCCAHPVCPSSSAPTHLPPLIAPRTDLAVVTPRRGIAHDGARAAGEPPPMARTVRRLRLDPPAMPSDWGARVNGSRRRRGGTAPCGALPAVPSSCTTPTEPGLLPAQIPCAGTRYADRLFVVCGFDEMPKR